MPFPCVSEICRRIADRLAEPDKQLHIRWSFWLTLAAHILWPLAWAVAAVFALGLAKECWDHRHGSGFCFVDIACNLIGIACAVAASFLLPGELFG